MIFTVQVGWARKRPPADHEVSTVIVEAHGPYEAELVAAQIVACRPECVMPTSAEIMGVAE